MGILCDFSLVVALVAIPSPIAIVIHKNKPHPKLLMLMRATN